MVKLINLYEDLARQAFAAAAFEAFAAAAAFGRCLTGAGWCLAAGCCPAGCDEAASQVGYGSRRLAEAISSDRKSATCAEGDQDSLGAAFGCRQHWLLAADEAAEGALASHRRSGRWKQQMAAAGGRGARR